MLFVRRLVASIGCIGVLWLAPISAIAAESAGDELMLMAPEVFESTVDYLMSLNLALFAVIGYFAKDGFVSRSARLRYCQEVLLIAFLAFGVASLMFAYWGRLELIEQLSAGTFIYEDLKSYAGQAWTLLIAGCLAGMFIFIHFLDKRLKSGSDTK